MFNPAASRSHSPQQSLSAGSTFDHAIAASQSSPPAQPVKPAPQASSFAQLPDELASMISEHLIPTGNTEFYGTSQRYHGFAVDYVSKSAASGKRALQHIAPYTSDPDMLRKLPALLRIESSDNPTPPALPEASVNISRSFANTIGRVLKANYKPVVNAENYRIQKIKAGKTDASHSVVRLNAIPHAAKINHLSRMVDRMKDTHDLRFTTQTASVLERADRSLTDFVLNGHYDAMPELDRTKLLSTVKKFPYDQPFNSEILRYITSPDFTHKNKTQRAHIWQMLYSGKGNQRVLDYIRNGNFQNLTPAQRTANSFILAHGDTNNNPFLDLVFSGAFHELTAQQRDTLQPFLNHFSKLNTGTLYNLFSDYRFSQLPVTEKQLFFSLLTHKKLPFSRHHPIASNHPVIERSYTLPSQVIDVLASPRFREMPLEAKKLAIEAIAASHNQLETLALILSEQFMNRVRSPYVTGASADRKITIFQTLGKFPTERFQFNPEFRAMDDATFKHATDFINAAAHVPSAIEFAANPRFRALVSQPQFVNATPAAQNDILTLIAMAPTATLKRKLSANTELLAWLNSNGFQNLSSSIKQNALSFILSVITIVTNSTLPIEPTIRNVMNYATNELDRLLYRNGYDSLDPANNTELVSQLAHEFVDAYIVPNYIL